MELAIKNVSDITYKCELIPPNAQKLLEPKRRPRKGMEQNFCAVYEAGYL